MDTAFFLFQWICTVSAEDLTHAEQFSSGSKEDKLTIIT